MLTDEEMEEMKPYGEAFISEQLFVPQRMTSVPFPTEAYVGSVMCCDVMSCDVLCCVVLSCVVM